MDNQRLFLYIGLGFLLLLIWQAWQEDYGPRSTQTATQTAPQPSSEAAPSAADPSGTTTAPLAESTPGDLPSVPTEEEPGGLVPPSAQAPSQGTRVRVETDALRIEIDTRGGAITQVDLLKYPVAVDHPDEPFRLMADSTAHYFTAQSGLQSAGGVAPTHHSRYKADQSEYHLADGATELRVPLVWTSDKGLKVTKTYVFRRDDYLIDLEYLIENQTGEVWTGRQYRQFQRSGVGDDEGSQFIYTYTGGVVHSQEDKYQKIDFDDMEEEDFQRVIKGGWAAMIQHYFLGAWVPAPEDPETYYTKALTTNQGKRYILGLFSASRSIASSASDEFTTRLFVGPKEQHRLEQVAEGLKLTVDYGILTILAQPLFWLLQRIHGAIGNWGWAIVLLTLLVKLVFYKLSEASYRSMANMRRLQPRLQALKERYGDDRQKMGTATMELYKKEKINPLGGCLPIAVQIPVFISLYWMLLESVELRQAPFMLWIQDLSTKDPFFVLPLIMGVTMFAQQKLNPAPVDPLQAKIFMVLPVVFTVFFAFFPAGLVLYWAVNNILSIAQQWYITRHVLAAAK